MGRFFIFIFVVNCWLVKRFCVKYVYNFVVVDFFYIYNELMSSFLWINFLSILQCFWVGFACEFDFWFIWNFVNGRSFWVYIGLIDISTWKVVQVDTFDNMTYVSLSAKKGITPFPTCLEDQSPLDISWKITTNRPLASIRYQYQYIKSDNQLTQLICKL